MEMFNPIHALLPTFIKRIANEYEAMHFYRNAANWCDNAGYTKAAAYFSAEAQSEAEHAAKVQSFLNNWGCGYMLPAINTVFTCNSLPAIIREAYGKYEVPLYKAYSADSKAAFDVDKSAFSFIMEMVQIQTDSVAEYRTLIDGLNLINENNKLDVYLYEQSKF